MYFRQMGNEASSVHIHSALTAEDLKALRAHFPGGGNSLEVIVTIFTLFYEIL